MYLKLTYLLTGIALLVSSCISDTPKDSPEKVKLTFDVSRDGTRLSRDSETPEMNHFIVFGDTKHPKSGTSNLIVMFNKTKVEYIDGNWCYDGTQYWVPNYEHSFVAVSPETIFESGNAFGYLNSKLTFDYAIPASGNATDILFATYRRLYDHVGSDENLDSQITFTFSHLLSIINFAPAFSDNNMSSDAYIEVHKLEISGVDSKAQFDIMPAPRLTGSATYDMEIGITGQEKGDFSFEFPTPVKIQNNGTFVKLFDDNDAIIMLPQVFAADSDAQVTLSYTINDDPFMHQVGISLKNLRWGFNTQNQYNFIIERTGIIFEGWEINPWKVITGNEIIVD